MVRHHRAPPRATFVSLGPDFGCLGVVIRPPTTGSVPSGTPWRERLLRQTHLPHERSGARQAPPWRARSGGAISVRSDRCCAHATDRPPPPRQSQEMIVTHGRRPKTLGSHRGCTSFALTRRSVPFVPLHQVGLTLAISCEAVPASVMGRRGHEPAPPTAPGCRRKLRQLHRLVRQPGRPSSQPRLPDLSWFRSQPGDATTEREPERSVAEGPRGRCRSTC